MASVFPKVQAMPLRHYCTPSRPKKPPSNTEPFGACLSVTASSYSSLSKLGKKLKFAKTKYFEIVHYLVNLRYYATFKVRKYEPLFYVAEAHNIVGKRMKLNNRRSFHGKMPIVFADNIGLNNH